MRVYITRQLRDQYLIQAKNVPTDPGIDDSGKSRDASGTPVAHPSRLVDSDGTCIGEGHILPGKPPQNDLEMSWNVLTEHPGRSW